MRDFLMKIFPWMKPIVITKQNSVDKLNFLNPLGHYLQVVVSEDVFLDGGCEKEISINLTKSKNWNEFLETLYLQAANKIEKELPTQTSREGVDADTLNQFQLEYCANLVANITRRGRGNLVLTGNKNLKDLSGEDLPKEERRFQFIYVPSIPDDEFIMCYNGSYLLDKAFYLEGDGHVACTYATVRGKLSK